MKEQGHLFKEVSVVKTQRGKETEVEESSPILKD